MGPTSPAENTNGTGRDSSIRDNASTVVASTTPLPRSAGSGGTTEGVGDNVGVIDVVGALSVTLGDAPRECVTVGACVPSCEPVGELVVVSDDEEEPVTLREAVLIAVAVRDGRLDELACAVPLNDPLPLTDALAEALIVAEDEEEELGERDELRERATVRERDIETLAVGLVVRDIVIDAVVDREAEIEGVGVREHEVDAVEVRVRDPLAVRELEGVNEDVVVELAETDELLVSEAPNDASISPEKTTMTRMAAALIVDGAPSARDARQGPLVGS